MSDIDSKKKNSKKDDLKKDDSTTNGEKILDYVKKLGKSIVQLCIIIIIGCILLYATKVCGSGIIDTIIATYYIEGLTDNFISNGVCINDKYIDNNTINYKDNVDTKLNTQYINKIKKNEDIYYQELLFELKKPLLDPNESLKVSLDKSNIEIITDGKKSYAHPDFFNIFLNAVLSNVIIFNLTLLNGYFKFLNKNFSDSATILIGPFISIIILLIIVLISLFACIYSIIRNIYWLMLNYKNEDNDDDGTTDKEYKINGYSVKYKSSHDLGFFNWFLWLGWCYIVIVIICSCIIPISLGITLYTILKWLLYICSFESTQNNKSYNFLNMFSDAFKYKKPLFSYIMSYMVISTSFDVFDTNGGIIAIIVFLLIYFNFIKMGLFEPIDIDDDEIKNFTQKIIQQIDNSKCKLVTTLKSEKVNFVTTNITSDKPVSVPLAEPLAEARPVSKTVSEAVTVPEPVTEAEAEAKAVLVPEPVTEAVTEAEAKAVSETRNPTHVTSSNKN